MITKDEYIEAKKVVEEYQKQLITKMIESSDRWKCNYCGRDTFRARSPHRCNGGFRKRGLTWTKIEANQK